MKKELQSLRLLHSPSKLNKNYFFLGLVIFYLLSIFSPNKLIYFSAYFVSTLFFYLSTKNLRISLLYSLILSLFSDFGLAKSLFIMQPEELNLGSGWSISPMAVFIIALLPFSFKNELKRIRTVDFFVLIFFLLSFISLFIFPYTNVLYGIISLGEVTLAYFIFRIHLAKEDLSSITKILISLILFQTILAGVQFLLQRPVGQVAESIITNNPYGLATIEDTNLFRLSGTFAHPNYLASFLLITIPFLFLYKTKNFTLNFLKLFPVLILFFTYSRASWIIFIIIAILMFAKSILSFNKIYFSKQQIVIFLGVILLSFTLLSPYISKRLQSFSLAFEQRGSFDVRLSTYQEALSIIQQYPLFGVGLYRSIEQYAYNPITDTFGNIKASRALGIHNTFLEIAAETGIPGLILFTLFLVFVFKHYFHLKSKSNFQKAAFYGLISLIGMSMFNPFFHSSQFRLFFLLSAIILT